MVFPVYLVKQQGFYRYNPLALKTGGPSRLFPHIGEDGTLRYMMAELRQQLSEQGQVSEPLSLVLAQIEKTLAQLDQGWDEVSVLLADLGFFQSGWVNFSLPPNEQFDSAYIKDLRTMAQVRMKADRAAKAERVDNNGWNEVFTRLLSPGAAVSLVAKTLQTEATWQRSQFYKALEENGRQRPKVSFVYEREGGLSDREFARQRLAGTNPMVLRRLQAPDQDRLAYWSSEQVYRIATGESLHLTEAASQNRLFIADYPLLEDLTPTDLHHGKYVGSPQALFYRSEQGLYPVLIQLEAAGKVFTPPTEAGGGMLDEWMQAKLYVQIADATHHELIAHLCYTHLAMEAFAIATSRQLPTTHPLFQLLSPHFKFLLAINNRGNKILLAEGAAIDSLLAPTGVASLNLIDRAYRERLLDDYSLPVNIQRRGLEAEYLPEFAYRDDAQLLWDAIANYTRNYLHRYYRDDQAVRRDPYLQAWAMELGSSLQTRPLSDYPQLPHWVPTDLANRTGLQWDEVPSHARVPGFPTSRTADHLVGEINSLQELIDLATVLIFTCGPQHAAVNFSQFDYLGYSPNAPMAAYVRPETTTNFEELLPPTDLDLKQMELTFALSGVNWSKLGDSQFVQFTDLRDRQILSSFQAELERIEGEIHRRNQHRRDRDGIDYPYLLPSQIPNSINI